MVHLLLVVLWLDGASCRVLPTVQMELPNTLEANITEESSVEQMAKLVDDYVVAANFDNRNVAQINSPGTNDSRISIGEPEQKILPKNELYGMTEVLFHHPASRRPDTLYSPTSTELLLPPVEPSADDRGALGPHGVAPLLASQRSVLAVGFITFLLLLNSFQNSMANMMALKRLPPTPTRGSLLNGLTQVVG